MQGSHFFSEIIHRNNNNARTLFATVERLTPPPVAIAPELSSTRACNEFASFFIEKVLKIRRSVGTLVSTPIPTLSPISTYAEKMTHFQTINQSSLDKIIENLSSATCCLDILPTGFLKKVLPAIREDLIQRIPPISCLCQSLKNSSYQTNIKEKEPRQHINAKLQTNL